MKLLLTSLSVALVTSTVSSAAPSSVAPDATVLAPYEAHPPASVGTRSTPALELARQLVAVTVTGDQYMDVMRAGAMIGASEELGDAADASLKLAAEQGVDHMLTLIEPTVIEQLPNLREAYAQAYAREFSTAELQQMLAFAATPAGRHYLTRSRVMEADPQVINMQQSIMGATMQVIMRDRKAACAAKAAARVAAGDTKAKCPLSAPTPRAG